MRNILALTIILLNVWTTGLLARPATTGYFVALTGSDANDGLSLATPFKTIQHCANVATAGDTCFIRAGTYRETVTPAHSGTDGNPITFTAYATETVTINGADVVTGWTLHTHPSGQVYRADMLWSLNVRTSNPSQITNDQIFVDGQMMPEARSPNIPVANLTRQKNADNARADSATVVNAFTAAYNDTALSVFRPNFWAGAKINFGPGYSIMHTTCDVTGSTPGSVSFQCNPDPGASNNRSRRHAFGYGNLRRCSDQLPHRHAASLCPDRQWRLVGDQSLD